MSTAVIEPVQVFGVDSDVPSNVCFIDEQDVVYPAGSTIVIYNRETKEQRFISESEGCRGFSAIAVSPNKRYIAVAEKRDTPRISIFDLQTLKKRKTLTYEESQSTEFICLAFSPDSKYLVSLGGAPDWNLLYWSWEKSRGPMASVRASVQADVPVYSVTFNPQDNTHLCVVGSTIFKMFRYQENSLKAVQTPKTEALNFLCQAWLSETQIVVGTDQNTVMLFDGPEFKSEFTVMGDNRTDGYRVECISATSTGFVCGGMQGSLNIFEQVEEAEMFKKVKEELVPNDTDSQQVLKSIAISPSEKRILISTDAHQMYTLSLEKQDSDYEATEGPQGLQLLSQQFHHKAITDISIAVRKPIVATCSQDGSLRVWNYEKKTLELVKYFVEVPLSVALHPSGLHVLVAFTGKLRLLNLLVDDVCAFTDFPIKNCHECAFSHGGHQFAVANGTLIEVYSTYTAENLAAFKGHNNHIKSIVWGLDDMTVTTCGVDGAVYEWDVQNKTRKGENVLKTCSYSCVANAPDGSSVFAVGNDKTIKQIQNNTIVKEVTTVNKSHTTETVLTQVSMSKSGRMLIAATSGGAIRAIKYPLTSPWEGSSLPTHCGSINKMCMSADDSHLFSVADDGCLFVYKLTDKEGRGLKTQPQTWADEILITRTDLEEKTKMLSEKETQVLELKAMNEYQVELERMTRKDQIDDLKAKFEDEIELLQTRLNTLKVEKQNEESKHEVDASDAADHHRQVIQDLEHNHNQKLLQEYEKYKDLQNQAQDMQQKCERQLSEMEHTKARALEDLAEFWENKLLDKGSQLDSANENNKDKERQYTEIRRQIEIDADNELLSIKNMYERKLKTEKEETMRLKGNEGILLKKFKGLNEEIAKRKQKEKELSDDQDKLHQHIHALERDIHSRNKEIEERDETIQDKEKRIYDLKKKNQELEKFKFVLDYKIKEMRKQIEPRENEIKEMTDQIGHMDDELQKYNAVNTKLTLEVESLQSKLRAHEQELRASEKGAADMDRRMYRMRCDLHESAALLTEPKKLASSIRSLYKTYCDKDTVYTTTVDEDVQRESNKQREFLETSNKSVRAKLLTAQKKNEADATRIMKENVALIREINNLRQELKISNRDRHQLESSLKTTRILGEMRSGHTIPDLAETVGQTVTLKQNLESGNLEKIIAMQKEQIRKLRTSVSEERPRSSGIQLEPLQA